jgi:hypothetical protein
MVLKKTTAADEDSLTYLSPYRSFIGQEKLK